MRRIDAAKLQALVSEVATVPVTSSLKDCLLRSWDDTLLTSAEEGGAGRLATAADAQAAGVGAKRGPKPTTGPMGTGLAQYAFVSADAVALVSDDEDEADAFASASSSSSSSVANQQQTHVRDIVLTPLPPHAWAELPTSLWPPTLAVSRHIQRPPIDASAFSAAHHP